jgi:hypothetical protein
MTANYVLLEKITVGAAGASSVTFSGIPQTGYTDLVVKFAARGDAGAISRSVYLTFNGSTTSYSSRYLQGDGSAASSGTGGSTNIYAGECTASTATASTFANQELYIPNYASSNYKSVSVDSVAETNATTQYMGLQAGLWSNTAAITSLTLTPGTGNFAQYSTFYLYGVAKLGTTPAIVPYATGGDTIMTDGTYWYHTFVSSGTFTPQKAITCDYLVVAGGGGGGASEEAGGGGAGGLRSTVTATGGGGSLESALSLGTSAYTVTVGAGGAGAPGPGIVNGTAGSNSVFSTITSTGGGYGAKYNDNGGAGGSGGGGGGNNGSTGQAGGAGTANQGFAGGKGTNITNRVAGGGGGAGAVGQDASESPYKGGNGGAGVAVSITGSSITYAGGGGGGNGSSTGNGGTGGSGGGGNGGTNGTNATAGTANLGAGGGGAGYNGQSGFAGGSGIVVIRYAV